MFGKGHRLNMVSSLCGEKSGIKKKATYSLNESSSDFRSLGVQCNSHWSVGDGIRGKALCGFSHILDCALMILAKGKRRKC